VTVDDDDDHDKGSIYIDDSSEPAGDMKSHAAETVAPHSADDDDILDTDVEAKTYHEGQEVTPRLKKRADEIFKQQFKPRITYPVSPILSDATGR
jgi:hypothetical protein